MARSKESAELHFGLGLTQPGDPVTLFPLAALLQQLNPFETLQNVPLATQGDRRAQTPML